MPPDGLTDDTIRHILATTRRIAVVGASNKPARPSYDVMAFLIAAGFDVTPVNPGLAGQTILGRAAVASLDDACPLDMVDIFRASDSVGPVVADAIRLGARSIWMQIGVINAPAASAARDAGLLVVMDRCPKIEMRRLGVSKQLRPPPRCLSNSAHI